FLKKGEPMQLDMPSPDAAEGYNFYAFGADSGVWEYEGTAPVARDILDLIMDTLRVGYGFDTTQFGSKFCDLRYRHLISDQYVEERSRVYSRHNHKKEELFYTRHWETGFRYSKTRMVRLIPRERAYVSKKEKEIYFTLDYYTGCYALFREYSVFRGFRFY